MTQTKAFFNFLSMFILASTQPARFLQQLLQSRRNKRREMGEKVCCVAIQIKTGLLLVP